jgi:hypothetical protein
MAWVVAVKTRLSNSLCWLLAIIMVLPLNGCTITSPVDGGNDDLPSRIRAQHLISEGDRVKIRTVDDREYRFKVRDVDDEFVRGDDVSVRIDDIAALSVRRFSGQRTVALVVVVILSVYAISIAASNSAENQL